jgi:methyl-accepting chemotaxis protein
MRQPDESPPPEGRRAGAAVARARLTAWRRAVLNRRSLGRAVMVAAIVAAITCLIGIIVAWQLVGDLGRTTKSSLVIAGDTLATVDDTLDVADSVIQSVHGGIGTVQDSLTTLTTAVDDGSSTLGVVSDLTADIAPSVERIASGLGGLETAAATVDGVLQQLSDLPFGPDYDPEAGLASQVQLIRDDLQPIADDLTNASGTLSDLAASSDAVIARLDELSADLDDIERSLAESGELIERYRRSTADALALATTTREDLDRDIWLSRILIVVLGLAIAVGQVAPFRIGRELARSGPRGDQVG